MNIRQECRTSYSSCHHRCLNQQPSLTTGDIYYHPQHINPFIDRMKRLQFILFLSLTSLLMTSTAWGQEKKSVYQFMPQTSDEGLEALIEIARSGNAHAQYKLGCIYLNRGLEPTNMQKCIDWLTRSSEQNFDSAQYKLALCYYDGKGVEQDFATALKWFRRAADQGHQSAMYYVGRLYARGEGVASDTLEAKKWIDQAIAIETENKELTPYQKQLNANATAIVRRQAEGGDPYAQYFLGLIYEEGKYAEKDLNQAAEWFAKAAAQGHRKAQEHLDKIKK